MELKEVKELLEQGFTPEQVVDLAKSLKVTVEAQTTKTPEEPSPEVVEMKKTISSLQDTIKAIQLSNLQGAEISNSNATPERSASDILAEVFYGKKEA